MSDAIDVAATPTNEKQINLSGDRGVLKEILSDGEGEETPYEGCTASLHYTGRLVNIFNNISKTHGTNI